MAQAYLISFAISLAVSAAAGVAISLLQGSQTLEQDGLRLDDLSPTTSSYGNLIPVIFGQDRVTAQLIWATDIEEVVTTKKKKQGGKGGGGTTVKTTEYNYYGSFAVMLCFGEVTVEKIWFNNKIVYDGSNNQIGGEFRVYSGSSSQLPDPLIQANLGSDNTPAYRYRAYIVFEKIPLNEWGNRIPSISVAVKKSPSPYPLASILNQLCLSSGLTQGEIDTSEITDTVTGYAIKSDQSIKEHLAELQSAYFFYLIESEGKIKFIRQVRNEVTAVISPSEIGCYQEGNNSPSLFEKKTSQMLDLPTEIEVIFKDFNFDYLNGNQYAWKFSEANENKVKLDLPLILTASEAKTIANKNLINSWSKVAAFKLYLPLKYVYLEAGDVIQIQANNTDLLIQIKSINLGTNYLLEVEAFNYSGDSLNVTSQVLNNNNSSYTVSPNTIVFIANDVTNVTVSSGNTTYTNGVDYTIDSSGNLTILPTGSITNNTNITVNYQAPDQPLNITVVNYGAPVLSVLDIPLVVQSDDELGVYIFTYNPTSNYQGCDIYISIGTNDNYKYATTAIAQGIGGTCNGVLGNGTAGVFDNINTLSVTVNDELESVSLSELNNGANTALIGQEMIRFQNAALTAPNTYTISGLERGVNGTDWATTNHQSGEKFTLVSDYLVRITGSTNLIGETLYVKAVVPNQDINDANTVNFTMALNSLKPWTVKDITAESDSLGNIKLKWLPRYRHDIKKLGEDTEVYRVEVLNNGTSIRVIENIYQPEIVYLSSDQIIDFGSNQTTITVKIIKISSIVGQGYSSSQTLTPVNVGGSFLPVNETNETFYYALFDRNLPYTLTAPDHGTILDISGTGNVIIPNNNSAFSVGWWCEIRLVSTGVITFSPESNQVLEAAITTLNTPWESARIIYNGNNTWQLNLSKNIEYEL